MLSQDQTISTSSSLSRSRQGHDCAQYDSECRPMVLVVHMHKCIGEQTPGCLLAEGMGPFNAAFKCERLRDNARTRSATGI